MSLILESPPSQIIKEFISQYCCLVAIDKTKLADSIRLLTKYYRGTLEIRNHLRSWVDLENKWYSSLKAGDPDYSVYDDDYYVADLCACLLVYSRHYLKSLYKDESIYSKLRGYHSFLDLGCGIGYTTAALSQMFPHAVINATNLEGTKQFAFCESLSCEYGFSLYSDISHLAPPVDTIFASEYFEHIYRPLEHLHEIIARLNPKCFIIANSFNTRSVGHFITYAHKSLCIPQQKISRAFNACLVRAGYDRVKTQLWNNRPAIWVRYA